MRKKIIIDDFAATESGHGGISYAVYFMAIVISIVLFAFLRFNTFLYVVEETVENGLHIVESAAITTSEDDVENGYRTDTYEQELQRMHIVTECVASDSWGTLEKSQVEDIGKAFASAFINQMDLENNTNPSSGILSLICGEDSDVLIINGTVKIYEPVYEISMSKQSTGNSMTLTPGYVTSDNKTWDFTADYTITGWVEYDLYYTNNAYIGADKTYTTTTPTLYDGSEAEGATLEAGVGISFKGIQNIFAGVSTETPTVGGDVIMNDDGTIGTNTYTISSVSDEQMFSSEPTQETYDVTVMQAVDIVIADQDSREE